MVIEYVNGNGIEEFMDIIFVVIYLENFQILFDVGLLQKVVEKLDEIYVVGKN